MGLPVERLTVPTVAPFAAVADFPLTVPDAKRVQLAAFSRIGLNDAEYRAFDLPLKVGRMTEAQQHAFAPEPSLGRYEYGTNMRLADFASMTRADFTVAARAMLGEADKLMAGSRHDREKPRFQPGEEARVMQQLARQADVVGNILHADQQLIRHKGAVVVGLELIQDRPMPWAALARPMHTDGLGIPGPLHRSYLSRSRLPPEFIRDQAATSPLAEDKIYQSLTRGEYVSDGMLNPWLTRAKTAGLVVVPEPFDVTLMSRQKTLHRSSVPERPDQMELSTYLRVMVAPTTY